MSAEVSAPKGHLPPKDPSDLPPPPPRWRSLLPAWIRGLIWVEEGESFDAFLSYSWAADSKVAPMIQSVLQQFLCPWFKPRARRIFRDLSYLPVSANLSKSLEKRLDASKHLIVLATPEAAKSEGMAFEADHWLSVPRTGEVLVVVTSGEYNNWDQIRDHALPLPLRSRLIAPPLFIDISKRRVDMLKTPVPSALRGQLTEDLQQLILKFYEGQNKDWGMLRGEERSQRRKAQALAWFASLVLLAAMGGAIWQAFVAHQQRDEALARARLALSRQLAAEAQTYLPVQPDLAALLGIEAYRVQDTAEARSALLAAVNERPRLLKTLPRMPDHPLCAALTRSGTLLAIGGASGTIQLWELPNGKPVGENFGVADDSVWKLTFDASGTMLITATDNAVRLWKLDGARPVSFTLPHSEERMLGIDLSPDGSLLVAGGDNGRLYVWSMLPSLAFRVSLETRSKGVWALAFSPDGKTFAVGTRDGHILLYQSERLAISGSLPSKGHGQLMSMSFRPDGQALVAGYDDGTILVWSPGTHHVVSTIKRKGPRRQVTLEVAFSPDGKTIASGGTYEVVTLWNADTGQSLDRLPFTGSAAINALLFTPDGENLVAVQEDYGVIWDATGTHGLSRVLKGHADKVWALAAAPLGDLIASGGKDATVFLWPVGDGRREDPPLRFGERTVRGMAFSPDGAELAVGYGSGVVALWRIRDHERIGEPLRVHTNVVHSLAFTPDGRYLVSGSSDHSVAIFDLRDAKLINQYWHGDLVNDVAISPDGALLASSGDDNKIILWNLKTNSQSGSPIAGGSEATEHVLFSRDSKSLYWFNGKRIVSWKIGTPYEQRVYLQGHIDDVNGLDISPDGRTLASATMENEVVLWDLTSRERLGRALRGHSSIVWKAVFASNGRVVASSSNDRTVRLWDVDIDHWIARACAIANRNLTEEEWAQYQQGMPRRPTCPSVQF